MSTEEGRVARRLMIVDDDEEVADAICFLARTSGHIVIWAPTGDIALSVHPSFDPEIVFLDLHLPDMDGYDIARRFRTAGERRRPLLCAFTGSIGFKAWEEAALAGFDEYLAKPVYRADLERIIALRPPALHRRRRSDLVAVR
jgi:CheY-like chemotaxis protein